MLNNTSHAGKETENKYLFKREQKTGRVVADVMSVDRLLHKRLSATGKARSPTVTSLVDGTTRALDVDTECSVIRIVWSRLQMIYVLLYHIIDSIVYTILASILHLFCSFY